MQQNGVTVFCHYEINSISIMAKNMLIKVLGKKPTHKLYTQPNQVVNKREYFTVRFSLWNKMLFRQLHDLTQEKSHI